MLTDDGSDLTIQLAQSLLKQQWKVVVLSFPESICGATVSFPETINRVVLPEMGELHLKEQLAAIAQDYGAVGAFIHLNPLNSSLSSAQAILKQVFLSAKYLKTSLNQAAQQESSWFVTVSRLDGELGVSPSDSFPISGGLFGLTKSLNLEWDNVFCRGIDLSPQLDIPTSVKSIMAELFDPNRLIVEVGYGLQGRMTLVGEVEANSEAISEFKPTLNHHSVLLVSGGGRGITAQCAIQLAKYFQCKFILLGRSHFNPEPEWAQGYQTEVELKRKAIAFLTSQGGQPKPIEVTQLVKSILAQREIRQTLEAISQEGGEAEYLRVDITQELVLRDKLTAVVNKLGNITGIIHGAGVLADKLIEQKSGEDFDRVYRPKVTGLQNILRCVELSQIKHLVLFSSVAGFYGNIGQTDYAVANEILNKFAYSCQQHYPACQVVAINWGAWDGGMVTPEIKRILAQRNITTIPVQLGTEILVDEFNRNDQSRIQVLVGSPLVRNACSLDSELKTYYLKRTLTLEENPFIQDHTIAGNPVLPMTCAANWMAIACEELYPGYQFLSLENFKVLKGIVFDNSALIESPIEYIFKLQEKSKKIPEFIEIEITVSSEVEINQKRFHYSGRAMLVRTIPPAPIYKNFNINPDPKLINLSPYQDGTLFHQGVFQGINQILNISRQTITLECNSSSLLSRMKTYNSAKGMKIELETNTKKSILADIAMQSILVWLQYFHQTTALPFYTKKLEVFGQEIPTTNFYVSSNIVSFNGSKLVTNVIGHDNQGNIYYRAFDVKVTVSKHLKKLFNSPQQLSPKKSPKNYSQTILFPEDKIAEFCTGSAAKCFGSEYTIYDQGTIKASRLPNAEFNLLHRVLSVKGKRHQFTIGSAIATEYDTPLNPWYYDQNSSDTIPYVVLMELGLQPCGFLSAYLGTTLIYPTESLYFRNLDGQGKLIKNIDLRGKTVTNTSTLLTSSNIPGMILQSFTFNLACQGEVFYQGEASFGHFNDQALAKQTGLDRGQNIHPWYENNRRNLQIINIDLNSKDSHSKYYQVKPHKPHYRLGKKLLNLIHSVKIIPKGGESGQGYIYAKKQVLASDWYFKCHFFQDPVMPGSLGVEAILQGMQVYALHLDLAKHLTSPRFMHLEHHNTIWKYRGQIPQPSSSLQIYLEIHLTKVEVTPEKVIIIGNASLWKPNLRIYEIKNIGICLMEAGTVNEQNKANLTTNNLTISQLQINNYPLNY